MTKTNKKNTALELPTQKRGYKFTHFENGKTLVFTKLQTACRELGLKYMTVYSGLFRDKKSPLINKLWLIDVVDYEKVLNENIESIKLREDNVFEII